MGDIHDTRLFAALVAGQKGIIRSDQLRTVGRSAQSAWRLQQAGWLHAMYDGVYAVGHTALTQQAHYLAATYALWPDGVLGHRACGAYRRLVRAPSDRIDIIVPTYNGHPHRGDIRIHRQALRDDECEEVDGIRCTTVCRTVLDLAATSPRLLPHAFEEAQIHHKLSPAQLAEELVLRPGHRGTALLRQLLLGAVDPGEVQSRLELRFLKLCAAFGLGRPLTQVAFGRWTADFYFPEERVVIETDGERFHASAAKRRRDKQKTIDLEEQGELVRRMRWTDVVHNPATTAAELDALLRARRLS